MSAKGRASANQVARIKKAWGFIKQNPWQFLMMFVCPPLLVWSGYWAVWDFLIKDWEGVAYAIFGIFVGAILLIVNFIALVSLDNYDKYYRRSKGVS